MSPRMAVTEAEPPQTVMGAFGHSPTVSVNVDVTPPKTDVRPGLIDKELFKNDPSCFMWEKFNPMDMRDPIENLQAAAAIPAKYMPKPFEGLGGALRAIEYWAKHSARTSYFVANAVTGIAASTVLGERSEKSNGRGQEFSLGGAPIIAAQQILQSVKVFEEDWLRIVQGSYAMPWDLSDGHQQNTPAYAVRQSARVVQETMEIMDRQKRNTPADRSIWLGSSDSIYPEYYKTNYHYQTDGWMSKRSADVYETATEVIFFGRQDAMQRLSLVPLKDMQSAKGRPLRILEVACGTGRFGTFIRDNHPTAEVTYVDLSPFYLEKARENDDYWRRFRSSNNGGKPYEPAKFVQAAAEALPFDAGEFDAVVCVYLFHEMPEGPRAAAAAEMARVLAPGGTMVLSDSIQRGDRPILDDALAGFENLNEPHYRNYISTPLADLFTRHGLECGERFMACTSKTLSFTKPATS